MKDNGRSKYWSKEFHFALFSGVLFAFAGCQSLPQEIGRTVSSAATAVLSSPQVRDGSIVLLAVTLPPDRGFDQLSGDFEGASLLFFPSSDQVAGTYNAMIAVPHGHKAGQTEVRVQVATTVLTLPLTVVDGKYDTEQLRVNPRKVNPNRKDMIRIQKEQAEIGLVYSRLTREKLWNASFQLPIESPVTSAFGTRRFYNGEMRNFHPGLDLKAAEGTPIRAPAGAEVALAKNLFFTGNTVILDHGFGLITLYAHMSRMDVKPGQKIGVGHLLGLSGKTGRVTGPHLHWQAVIQKTKVNPMDLVKVLR